MFGRSVKVGDREVFVLCCPDTPLSEVLFRAAQQAEKAEHEERTNSPLAIAYKHGVRADHQ